MSTIDYVNPLGELQEALSSLGQTSKKKDFATAWRPCPCRMQQQDTQGFQEPLIEE